MIDPVQADADWEKNTDHSKRSPLFAAAVRDNRESAQRRATSTDVASPEPIDEPVDSDKYRQARADREQLKLAQELLDLQERQGRIIDVQEASLLVSTALRALRDRLLTVPFRLAAELAALNDPQLVEQRLLSEIESALQLDQATIFNEADDDDDS